MRLEVPCARGCGGTIEVDEQTLSNAAALGVDLRVSHDTCRSAAPAPQAEIPRNRRFRAQIMFVDVPDGEDQTVTFPEPTINGVGGAAALIAQIGITVDARNFAEAVNGPFTTWLNTTWPRLQENAALADLPDASTGTVS